jgi:hypothetical protein
VTMAYKPLRFLQSINWSGKYVRPKTRTWVNEYRRSGKDICELHEFSFKIYSAYRCRTDVALLN